MDNKRKKRVLFICTHNSSRSQMAEAFLNHYYPEEYHAYSAGLQPGKINPYVLRVMEEKGLDLTHHKSESLTDYIGQDFDLVVTVCSGAAEACPVFLGARKTHNQSFPDPSQFQGTSHEILQATRKVRDQIDDWIKNKFRSL